MGVHLIPHAIGHTGNALRQIHGRVNKQIRFREIQVRALELKSGHHLFAQENKRSGPVTGYPPMPPGSRSGWSRAGAWLDHSLTIRTSPRRSTSAFRVSVSRRSESVTMQFGEGLSLFSTASTASALATAATQSDLRPSGAVTSTMGILVRKFGILGIYA